MSNISMVESKLPPGFRFHPKDEELVCDYLMKKIDNLSDNSLLLIDVDLNKCEPWDIPEIARVGGKEWYFYSQRDRKYATGIRTNRATASGYWKATGKDRAVLRKGTVVGMRKTLVFYKGRAPKGTKSDWVMHEFRLHSPPHNKEDWVLCRVFYKSREIVGKASSMGRCYDDTLSSSLPPLMDSYISFDQTQPNLLDIEDDENDNDFHYGYEQVPCFSIFSPNQTNLINPFGGQLPSSSIPNCPNLDNDKKAIKAFLNQLNQFHGSSSLGDDATSETYLSQVGMSNLWTNHPF